MSEKKIVVPDGMLKAVQVALREYWSKKELGSEVSSITVTLEAALRWLSENPIVPTLIQIRNVESAAAHEPINSTRWISDVMVEWQRLMLLASEPAGRITKGKPMFDEEARILNAAEFAHEINRLYCMSHGDLSHKSWPETPDSIQNSVISGVKAILDNPAITPEQSHQLWLDYKKTEGWVYGEVKDLEKKTHPCFRPYNELPLVDRIKDAIFGLTVRQSLGLQTAMKFPGEL